MRKLPAIALLLLSLLPSNQTLALQSRNEYVVLLHGLNRHASDMGKIEERLGEEGYDVINIDYPSTTHTVEELSDMIAKTIAREYKDKSHKINFVSFSIGSIILRQYLYQHPEKHLGRVVMLGPPNHGSEVSNFLRGNPVTTAIYGPAGDEVGTDAISIFHKLPQKANFELGIIAGNSSISPFFSIFVIPGEDDGVVSIENTKLAGMKDHIVVDSSHEYLPSNPEAIRQVVLFLEKGKFDHDDGEHNEETGKEE